jgi:hypothetical protein
MTVCGSSERMNLTFNRFTQYVGRNAFTTVLMNLIVLCGLLLSTELAYRMWLYFRSCDRVCYDIAFLTKLDAFNRNTAYGFLAADPITGYSPTDKTVVIHEAGWNGVKITIREGVRVNPNFAPTSSSGAILAVGDSFVFGDQVSDDESWPAILEQRLNRRVVNGGVSGYGPLQAVLRAEQLINTQAFSGVILSILVGDDLPRDQYVNAWNFYQPAVIRKDGQIRSTTVAESGKIASENFVCAHPWIPEMFFWSHLAKRIFSQLGYDGRCSSIRHPKAATIDEILNFVVERFAALPSQKTILIQYSRPSFGNIVEAQKIRDAANRHGIQIIDTYKALKEEPLQEIYIGSSWWPHHSKRGNAVVADLIAKELAF